MSIANERLEKLRGYKATLETNFKELREEAAKDVVFDKIRLDDESLRNPKLHNRWLQQLAESAYELKKAKNSQARLELERWKYFNGKQTDKYYADYGIPHEKTIKTDLDKYIKADDFITEMNEIVELHSLMVDFLEKTVKDISTRTFSIQNAIGWRKFEAGQ